MGAGNYLSALDAVKEAEQWLEDALKDKKGEPEAKPPVTIPPPPEIGDTEAVPEEPEPEEPEAQPEEPPTEPAVVEPERPSINLESISAEGVDPGSALGEGDEALKSGDVGGAVDKYILTMEALEGRTRAIVEEAISKAKERIAKVKEDGYEAPDAEADLEVAEKELSSGAYKAATRNALSAFEKADSSALAEINKAIDEARKALDMATAFGADIAIAEDMVKNAEEALTSKDFNVALEFADKAVSEVEKTSNESVANIILEGKELIDKASELGVDVSEVKAHFEEVQQALDDKDFAKAHETAKKAVDLAGRLPRDFVREKVGEARSKVLAIEKSGGDSMMAKNFLIRARSSMAAGDFSGALKACEKCIEEADKAPKTMVNKKIAATRADMEAVRSIGQNTDEVEGLLNEAEEKVGEGDFEEAQNIIGRASEMLKEIKDLGTEATNAIFDADVSISVARDAGKDVTKANELLNEAMTIRAQDPGKAKELAEEIMKMLEE
jgi:tetratricopeptide (TPR) repeat protein